MCARNFIPKGSFVCEVVGQYRHSGMLENQHHINIMSSHVNIAESISKVIGHDERRVISIKKWCTGVGMSWSDRLVRHMR